MTEIKIKNSSLPAGKSIKSKILVSYGIILFFMAIFAGVYYYNIINMNKKYGTVINNTERALGLKDYIQDQMYEGLWDIVSGNITLEETRPLSYVLEIKKGITEIEKTTESPNSIMGLHAIERTLETLEMYTRELEAEVINNSPVTDMEDTFYEIRHVTKLVDDLLEDFIMAEFDVAAAVNADLETQKKVFLISMSVFFVVVILSSTFLCYAQLRDIQRPLVELEKYTSQISNGNFRIDASLPMIDEFVSLGQSLANMSYKLEKLLKESVENQKNLRKSEMQALQAQIAPHFLYNTLDTIVWLTEEGRNKEAITVTRAFSKFFRISLSKGRDWIYVKEELEHAKSYLRIQKIRYRDILQYEIIEDINLKEEKMLKLLLQPIIENALYHGLKRRRTGRRGFLRVLSQREKDYIYFEVTDNGVGMSPEELKRLTESFQKKPDEMTEGGYGLYNVNRRLSIYYGEEYKLYIESKLNEGTKVFFRIPFSGRLQI